MNNSWLKIIVSASIVLTFVMALGCEGDKTPVKPEQYAPPPGPEDEKGDNEKG